MSFSGGTAVSNVQGDRRYRFIGDAAVHHEVGRTWVIRGAFQQGFQVVDIFLEPLYGYTARMIAEGLIAPRLEL